ncbi:MAG TPA: F0F1 ATP synthase subunit B' [Xanthobacteraceae bacterium]|jgi:F-type H+-transporting ATPase subunit b
MAENTTIETTEHQSERGGGFPPFQKENFPSQLVWLAITFVALYLLMSRVALPRVAAIFEIRRKQRDADLAEAGRLKSASEEALAGYEKALSDARSRAQSLAAEARQKQAADAEAARTDLDAKLNARIAEAADSIHARRAAAMANVHAIAADAATAILERLIGRTAEPGEVKAAVAGALNS